MNVNAVSRGLWVRVTTLGDTSGFRVQPKYLEARQEGARGRVVCPVPGTPPHWWMRHEDGCTAAYSAHELEPCEASQETPESDNIFD